MLSETMLLLIADSVLAAQCHKASVPLVCTSVSEHQPQQLLCQPFLPVCLDMTISAVFSARSADSTAALSSLAPCLP